MGPSETTKTIATTLVENCRAGKDRDNLEALYAQHAISVEAFAQPGDERVKEGLDAIHAKHDWWEANMEPLEEDVKGPFYNGDDMFSVIFSGKFKNSVIFSGKFKNKESGEVFDMLETATYHLEGGKVVREEFFYAM